MGKVVHFVPQQPGHSSSKNETVVFFTRAELDAILRVYGRMVAIGEWKDYSLTSGAHSVTFAIYKRFGDAPIYRIEKRPKSRKNGPYILACPKGILKYNRDLRLVLAYFDTKKFLHLQS